MKANIVPALALLAIPIGSVTLDPHNARLHTPRGIEVVAHSLTTFGQYKPIVVRKSDNTVVVGNGRLMAARKLKWDSIAAIIVEDSDVESVVRALSNNRTSDLSEFDYRKLALALPQSVAKDATRLALIGFSPDDLKAIIAVSTIAPPAKPGSTTHGPDHVTIFVKDIPLGVKAKIVGIVRGVLAANPNAKDLRCDAY